MPMKTSGMSSSQSILRSISARLDAASGVISACFLMAALAGTVIVTFAVVKPNISKRTQLEERLANKQDEVEAIKQKSRITLDRIEAYRDPYYIARFAQERYNFKPAPAEGNVSR